MTWKNETWQEMQRDAAPAYHKCPFCKTVASDHLMEQEIPLTNDGWWYLPVMMCDCCAMIYDTPEPIKCEGSKT